MSIKGKTTSNNLNFGRILAMKKFLRIVLIIISASILLCTFSCQEDNKKKSVAPQYADMNDMLFTKFEEGVSMELLLHNLGDFKDWKVGKYDALAIRVDKNGIVKSISPGEITVSFYTPEEEWENSSIFQSLSYRTVFINGETIEKVMETTEKAKKYLKENNIKIVFPDSNLV